MTLLLPVLSLLCASICVHVRTYVAVSSMPQTQYVILAVFTWLVGSSCAGHVHSRCVLAASMCSVTSYVRTYVPNDFSSESFWSTLCPEAAHTTSRKAKSMKEDSGHSHISTHELKVGGCCLCGFVKCECLFQFTCMLVYVFLILLIVTFVNENGAGGCSRFLRDLGQGLSKTEAESKVAELAQLCPKKVRPTVLLDRLEKMWPTFGRYYPPDLQSMEQELRQGAAVWKKEPSLIYLSALGKYGPFRSQLRKSALSVKLGVDKIAPTVLNFKCVRTYIHCSYASTFLY